jgi:hypothetical protein
MTKLQKILAGLLILQIGLTVIVFLSNRPAIASNNPLIKDFTPDEITSVTIYGNTGEKITMVKSLGNWVLPEADNYPVKSQNITDLLEKVATIHDNRLVTNTKASHARLQVDEKEYQQKLEFSSPKVTTTLFIGSSPAANNVHIRLGKSDAVYLTNALSSIQLSPTYTNWIDTSLVQISSASVKSVTFTSSKDSFHFIKDNENNWKCEELVSDETLDPSKWSSILSGFTNIRLVAPVSKTAQTRFGLDNPTANLHVIYLDESNNSQEGELIIGSKDESGSNYYAKWSLSPYIVTISSYNAERIINLQKEDFTPTPPTATSQP